MKKASPYIKCVVFLLLLAVIFAGCDYAFSPSGYIRFIVHEVHDKDVDYDTVILGASHARSAIDPQYMVDEMGGEAINYAIPGETMWDSYYLLKDAGANNDIKTLILDVDYQYWTAVQPTTDFSRPFIYQQLDTFSKVKAEYAIDNMKLLDIRNVFADRLSYDISLKSAKKNISMKMSDAYRNYSLDGAIVTGADGPYVGRGFFSRITSGSLPGGQDYLASWFGRQWDGLDEAVLGMFDQIKNYCDNNGIRLICVTSAVTPSAMKQLGMETIHKNLAGFFNSRNVEYIDFNMTKADVLPRKDEDYGDMEGHMGGELADRYSRVLAKVLKEAKSGSLDRSKYFYKTFNQCYEDMGYGKVVLNAADSRSATSVADADAACY